MVASGERVLEPEPLEEFESIESGKTREVDPIDSTSSRR